MDGIDFTVTKGQTLGVVGDSGCGKTATGRPVTRQLVTATTVSGGKRATGHNRDV